MALSLSSDAFSHGGWIAIACTCDGSNVSPPLAWSDIPAGTAGLSLVCYDPDAPRGTFYHWGIYDLAPHVSGLDENAGARAAEPKLCQAMNDFGHAWYDGPCPPHGHGVHHYHFRLSALRERLSDVSAKTHCAEILAGARSLEIASAELVGRYQR